MNYLVNGNKFYLESKLEKEVDKKLFDCISKLDNKDRTFLTLYYYENLKCEEIANIMNSSVSAVSIQHKNIIKKLDNSLANE